MAGPNRVSAGVPTGGQFAPRQHADDTVTLRQQLRQTKALGRDLVRRQAVLTAQIIAAEILEEAPNARYFELTYATHGGGYDMYGLAVLDEGGNEILDDDGLPVVEAGDWEDHVGSLPDIPNYTVAWDPNDPTKQIRTPARGWEWIADGDNPRIDLHAVRAIDPDAPLTKESAS